MLKGKSPSRDRDSEISENLQRISMQEVIY